ncbi:hypothetical protein HY629_01995 [Candidatus Uhrbacteria bacterium]|nr:hypothetical protein [Candidatus Uhrbacteria bacterium]
MPRTKKGFALARTAITGRARKYDRLHIDPRLYGHWIIFEVLTTSKFGHLDTVVILGVYADDGKKTAFTAYANLESPQGNPTSIEYMVTPEEARMPHILGAAS